MNKRKNIDLKREDNNDGNVRKRSPASHFLYNLQTAIRILVVMVIVLGIAYPVLLAEIREIALPFQSGGSILEYDDKKIGSKLLAQEFESPKFFHTREAIESASTVDPHITPDMAYSQIKNVSEASGIHQNTLRTLLNLNVEQNKVTNGLFFAPDYVNVLEVNLELVKQYPEIYEIQQSENENSSYIENNQNQQGER
jgi:K+-transporting ATPase ATPase C chain